MELYCLDRYVEGLSGTQLPPGVLPLANGSGATAPYIGSFLHAGISRKDRPPGDAPRRGPSEGIPSTGPRCGLTGAHHARQAGGVRAQHPPPREQQAGA